MSTNSHICRFGDVMINIKVKHLVIFSLLLNFLNPCPAFSNRGMITVGPKEVKLQETGQNAIVAWNGEEEIIILSTDIRSSESTLVLEVIPLPSNPVKVEEGSFDSFRKLTEMINEKVIDIKEKEFIRGLGSSGVEITFHKKIGAHDITVVKTNDLDYFINWVKEFTKNKGFKYESISEDFKNAVSSYLKRDIRFFVFDVIKAVEDRQSIKPLVYRFKTYYLFYPLEITATSDARWSTSNVSIFIITKDVINKDFFRDLYLQPTVGFNHNILLTKGELKEVSPELEDLFKSDAFVMNATYHGSLNVLQRDLFYSAKIGRAKEFFRKGHDAKDLSEKESFYLKAIELWPAYAEAHNNLGDVYEKQRKYNEAIKEYEIASALAPNVHYPHFGLGDIYFKMGKYEMAITHYEKGLKIEPDDKPSNERLRLSKVLTKKILFLFDSYELTDKAIKQLRMIAEALSSPELKDSLFEIQGHTDSTGTEEYNIILSKERAESAKEYLVKKGGIAADRLIVKGCGEDRPIKSNETGKGRQLNRRVEIKIDALNLTY